MFSVLKFVWILFRAFPDLLNIDRNALKSIPDQTKYLAMILLSLFWCLAFGLYFGELLTIGYNMIGHVALITMVFVTWWTFRHYRLLSPSRLGVDFLQAPDMSTRRNEITDEDSEKISNR